MQPIVEEMVPQRSTLFVPGNRPSWIEKSAAYGADSIILDLEDSVPWPEKSAARLTTKAGIQSLKAQRQRVAVRVNGFATGLTAEDVAGVVCAELDSISLPKVEAAADLQRLDALIADRERTLGLPVGAIDTPLICETAKAMRLIFEIAMACPRVKRVTLAAGPGGDAARAIGYQWSKEGTETLYLRSKAVLDCRAAGIQFPTISSWWNIKDLEGLRRDALWNRQLGFRGMSVMHPSHVPIVNEVFTPTASEIDFYRGLITAMDQARRRGIAAVVYDGDMVDEAMYKAAQEMLAFARAIGVCTN
jgi:citrate lyase subunit beta / citryl-CoA lyase